MNVQQSASLSMEQQFKLQALKNDIEKLTKEQAQEYLLECIRLTMIKENLFKDLIKTL